MVISHFILIAYQKHLAKTAKHASHFLLKSAKIQAVSGPDSNTWVSKTKLNQRNWATQLNSDCTLADAITGAAAA